MEAKDINKHLNHHDTANTLAYKAITTGAVIKKDGTTFNYDPQANILKVSDGLTSSYYEPLITADECDPFYRLLDQEM